MVEVMLKSSVSHVCGAARLFERRGNKHAIVAGSGWASVAAGCKDGCCSFLRVAFCACMLRRPLNCAVLVPPCAVNGVLASGQRLSPKV